MNYSLAKELKDAGFSQEGDGKVLGRSFDDLADYRGEDEIYTISEEVTCYVPTLSELIEACGDDFGQLTRVLSGEWDANNSIHDIRTNDSTPEEAVARLWLALNKK